MDHNPTYEELNSAESYRSSYLYDRLAIANSTRDKRIRNDTIDEICNLISYLPEACARIRKLKEK